MPQKGEKVAKAAKSPEQDEAANAYEYDENGQAVEPPKILSQNTTATPVDSESERQRLEQHLSKISSLESQMEKIAAKPAANETAQPVQVIDDAPKETELQKQMREGWSQDDDKDMEGLAKETLKN